MNQCISFSEDRIRNGMKKLQKAKQGTTQGRLDSFFSVVSTSSTKRKVSGVGLCMEIQVEQKSALSFINYNPCNRKL